MVNVFVDAQGFLIRGRFYPRELAICSKKGYYHVFFILPTNIEFTKQELKTINYCTRNIHGIPWYETENDTFSLPVSLWREILIHFCKRWAKNGFIRVRNNQLKAEMEKLNLKIYDMEKKHIKYEKNFFCKLHHSNYRCALNKVLNLYKTMNQTKKNE